MGRLAEQILGAIEAGNFLVSLHADQRCEERGVTAWQLVAEIDEAALVRERPASQPNPSIILRQILPDGSEVEAIWGWLAQSRHAKLITVYEKE